MEKVCCSSTNTSLNKCSSRPAIICNPLVNPNSVCSLLYSTFAGNDATSENCILFNRGGAVYEIKYCNILRNTEVSVSGRGTICTSGNLMIEDSCILENEATYIFYTYSSYTITLSNCTVDKTTRTGNLITQKTVTKSFILALNHMSTRNCHSEYDSAGTLTAIPPASPPTKKETCYCYTCKINNCQARISDFFSFICLFMFSFIQLDPSEDYWYNFDRFSG
jgi:hypothetical protein